MRNLIIAGFWFGSKKVNYSCFFQIFSEQIRILSSRGFTLELNGERILFYAFVIACCVDSGARGSVQEVHQHNGECGCNWCVHPGQRVGGTNNARMYCTLDYVPELRTREQMLRDGQRVLEENVNHVNGVIGISLLNSLPKFDIVSGMIVDPLHAKYLGVARQITKLWFGTDGIDKWLSDEHPKGVNPPYYIGVPGKVKKVNSRISKLTPTVESRRMPRGIQDLLYFKARDWENFVLHNSVLLLRDILPVQYLNHWILFVQGCHLLSQHTLSEKDIDIAEALFDRFVFEIEQLYRNGDQDFNPETPCKQMKFNVHLLCHAADNARRWGADWCISSYAYEAGNYDIKKMIKSNKGIANQIIRQVSQNISRDIMKCSPANNIRTQAFLSYIRKNHVLKCVNVGKCVLLGNIKPLVPTGEEEFLLNRAGLRSSDFVECSKVIVNHCVYTVDNYEKSSRRNNSVVRLKDKSFVMVRKILGCEATGKVFTFSSVIRVTPFTIPGIAHVPENVRFMYQIVLTEQEKHMYSVDDIEIVCVYSNVGTLGPSISPMPNIHTIC